MNWMQARIQDGATCHQLFPGGGGMSQLMNRFLFHNFLDALASLEFKLSVSNLPFLQLAHLRVFQIIVEFYHLCFSRDEVPSENLMVVSDTVDIVRRRPANTGDQLSVTGLT